MLIYTQVDNDFFRVEMMFWHTVKVYYRQFPRRFNHNISLFLLNPPFGKRERVWLRVEKNVKNSLRKREKYWDREKRDRGGGIDNKNCKERKNNKQKYKEVCSTTHWKLPLKVWILNGVKL